MKLDVIQQVDELSESLEKEDQLNSVRAIRGVIASLKQYAPTVQQMDDPYVHKLFAKVNDGAVQVARDILKEAYAIANTYVTGILVHDLAFLQRRMAGEEEKDVLIGFYHPEWNPLQSASEDRLQAIQQAVSDLNLDAIYFQSSDVDLEKNIIRGKRMVNGEAVDVESRYPDVIYNKNTGGYRNQDRVQRTLRRTIPFTQHVITDKLHLPLELHGESELTGLFIPAVYVNSTDVVKEFFEEHSVGVLKNTQEERGEGVLFIKKDGDVYTVQGLEGTYQYLEQEFYEEIKHSILPKSFILQNYVKTVTNLEEPYDIRVHPAKNEVGQWEILHSQVRIGSKKGILSNISTGGRSEKTVDFLKRQFGEKDGLEAYQIILDISLQMAKDVDRLYGYALDELGLDLTIDENYQIWMHEVNTGPMTTYYERKRANYILKYVKYLAESGIKPTNRFQKRIGFVSEESSIPLLRNPEGIKTIGIFVKNIDAYSRSVSVLANHYGVILLAFTAADIDAENRRIRARILEEGEWIKRNAAYPEFIIDRVMERNNKRYAYIYSEFENIPMTYPSQSLHIEKDIVLKELFANEETRKYLLPYKISDRVKSIGDLLGVKPSVVLRDLKNNEGSVIIEKKGRVYEWETYGRSIHTFTRQEIREKARELLKGNPMLIQPMYSFSTDTDMQAKVRIHFFRENDNWSLKIIEPFYYMTPEQLYLEEEEVLKGQLIPYANQNWEEPQVMLEDIKEASYQVIDVLSDQYLSSTHHVALDFGVKSERGSYYLIDITLEEPTDTGNALPTMEATLRYAIEQLEE